MFFVRPMRNRGGWQSHPSDKGEAIQTDAMRPVLSCKECPGIRREDGKAIRRTLRVLTMISLRIASDTREVETVELSLLVRHHPNGRMAVRPFGRTLERKAFCAGRLATKLRVLWLVLEKTMQLCALDTHTFCPPTL